MLSGMSLVHVVGGVGVVGVGVVCMVLMVVGCCMFLSWAGESWHIVDDCGYVCVGNVVGGYGVGGVFLLFWVTWCVPGVVVFAQLNYIVATV